MLTAAQRKIKLRIAATIKAPGTPANVATFPEVLDLTADSKSFREGEEKEDVAVFLGKCGISK